MLNKIEETSNKMMSFLPQATSYLALINKQELLFATYQAEFHEWEIYGQERLYALKIILQLMEEIESVGGLDYSSLDTMKMLLKMKFEEQSKMLHSDSRPSLEVRKKEMKKIEEEIKETKITENTFLFLWMNDYQQLLESFQFLDLPERNELKYLFFSYWLSIVGRDELEKIKEFVALPVSLWSEKLHEIIGVEIDTSMDMKSLFSKFIDNLGINEKNVGQLREIFNFDYSDEGKFIRIQEIGEKIHKILNEPLVREKNR